MSHTEHLQALHDHHNPGFPVGGLPTRLWAADIVTINPDGTVDCQPVNSRATKHSVPIPAEYRPTVGDRVLLAEVNGDPRTPVVMMAITAASSPIGSDRKFTFTQASAAAAWNIAHNLGKFPAVQTFDSDGRRVIGDLVQVDDNHVTVTFSAAIAGFAYCN